MRLAALVLVLVSLAPTFARACVYCSPDNHCVESAGVGNYGCTSTGIACSQFWPCKRAFQVPWGSAPMAVSLSFHPSAGADKAFDVPGAFRLAALGGADLDPALARRALATVLADPRGATDSEGVQFLCASAGFAIQLVSPTGDALAVTASSDTRGVELALGNGAPARTRLGEGEMLVTGVRLAGRPWWVVAQVHRLPESFEARNERLKDLQDELQSGARLALRTTLPALEVRPLP